MHFTVIGNLSLVITVDMRRSSQ